MPGFEQQPAALLEAVKTIARQAGRAILEVYGTDFEGARQGGTSHH
ncbi:MAG: hypothetical protein WDO12_13115 [Pseudomonadota bacterium]